LSSGTISHVIISTSKKGSCGTRGGYPRGRECPQCTDYKRMETQESSYSLHGFPNMTTIFLNLKFLSQCTLVKNIRNILG